jgi:hypothetical protein
MERAFSGTTQVATPSQTAFNSTAAFSANEPLPEKERDKNDDEEYTSMYYPSLSSPGSCLSCEIHSFLIVDFYRDKLVL